MTDTTKQKYLVTYTRPAKQIRRVIEAPSPEQAALAANLDDSNDIQEVVVQDVDGEEDPREVYQWCAVCGLPIWIDDETSSYTVLDNASEDTLVHTYCRGKVR